MARPSIYAAARAIESEFDEPLRDVIRGFFVQGLSVRSVSDVLEVTASSVARFARTEQLAPPGGMGAAAAGSPRTEPWRTSQAMRRAARRKIAFDGMSLSPAGWESVTGIHRDTIRKRIANGWTVDEALTTRGDCRVRWNRRRCNV